ncbi:MAG: DNA polymerase III subunit alpha [Haliscomenobacteraceae bacterium CHB4]|nr:DNA polymerase III subunit alpha [Saprospiraceae bacterium]MCE7922433.1 DNA polymerase III subunit alpha [Haliscomenobacteraceae bacterium CHB4]
MYLNAHTFFSLRYGTFSPQQLVEAAAAQGVKTLALTDINNTSAALDFVRICREKGIKPVLGIEFRDAEHRFLFTGIARNNAGWAALCALLTEHSLAGKPLPAVPPPMNDVFIVYDREVKPFDMLAPHEFIGIRPAEAGKLYSSTWRRYPERLVVWQPVTFPDTEGYRLHKLLRAMDANTLVTKLDGVPMAQPDEKFLPENELLEPFKIYPKVVQNTRRVLDACSIRFETGLQLNRRTFMGTKEGDLNLLTKLAESGCQRRYGPNHRRAQERVRKELKVIAELDFAAYFLLTWDIVRYAESAGYHHVGRGSGANSIVAYCLYITDVEPLELDLYFERFINPQRTSPPDFDIDFSWDERDDVTDYIFKRYGREHTALLATYSTFQHAAVIRELGKVFGLTKSDIDAIVEYWQTTTPGTWEWSGRKGEETVDGGRSTVDGPRAPTNDQPPPPATATATATATDGLHPWAQHILRYGKMLVDFPNYLSIHAGGIIISEKPLSETTALQMMPKGFPITHFDMYAAEEWGFHKFDVLSQRGLGHIKDCVDIVRENQGKALNVHEVERLKTDERVRAQLRSSRCMGCFYIESPAMRGLLRKLRCDNYVHLVAASSIIRPGVAKSGMMRAYIQRFHQPNGFEYLHPVFKEHLAETFGVMVYQEDVMKILHHFAGLGLDEADVMRRMMTGKKRSSEAFARLRQKYFDNCAARRYPGDLAREVWRQIESFGGYSFCKAHSASFAVESFQSLYLKTYFPLEFMVAVINNFGGFYSTEFYVHEARMAGAAIHAPCVNRSRNLTRIEGADIFLGLIHVRGLESQVILDIERQRMEFGAFKSLEDFVRRVHIAPTQLDILIRIGAFRFTGLKKSELLWEKSRVLTPESGLGANLLFADETDTFRMPALEDGPFDQAFDELELLGFPLCSPFDLLEDAAQREHPGLLAREMNDHVHQLVTMTGYYVCRKDTRTVKGELMQFGTWLDREGVFFDTVHFPDQLKKTPFRGRGVYRIRGRLTSDFGFVTLEAASVERLPYRADGRYGEQ